MIYDLFIVFSPIFMTSPFEMVTLTTSRIYFMIHLKTYAAISNAHLYRVWKRVKLSVSCLSTIKGDGNPDDYYVLYERS